MEMTKERVCGLEDRSIEVNQCKEEEKKKFFFKRTGTEGHMNSIKMSNTWVIKVPEGEKLENGGEKILKK